MWSVSSAWTLPLLTDTVELARRMALLLARRGQQVDCCTPCWLEMEVLRLVRKPTVPVLHILT